jgi:oxygen-dependent protoporphyrinogen oxidase
LVVGAGISGLVCAYALRKAGIDAQVIEASPRPGGLIRSEKRDGFLLELGPQSFSSTSQLRELFRDLGIENELVEAPPRAPRFLLVDGQLKPAPLSPPAFFASSLFSGRTKWSVLRDLFGHTRPPENEESIATFVRRKFSAELLEKFAGPFVSGIYAGDAEKLSLRAAFPQLFEAERASGSIIRGMLRAAKAKKGPREKPTLFTFRDGNETLVQALAASLGPALRSKVSASAVQMTASANGPKYEINLTSGPEHKIIADNLVLATPTQVACSLLRGIDQAFEKAFDEIEYAPVAVVSLGYRAKDTARSLDGFGFLIPRSAGLRVLGTVWNSSLFPGRAPADKALLTSFVGGTTDPQVVNLSSNELVSLVHREIAPVMQIRQAPVFSNVTLYASALPQYNLGHTGRLASLEQLGKQFPGLYLAGNYFRGPSIGACTEQALAIAEGIRSRVSSHILVSRARASI